MRATLMIVAFIAAGCAGTKDAKQTPQTKSSIPVMHENPKISDRARYQHEQDQKNTMIGRTVVEGNIER